MLKGGGRFFGTCSVGTPSLLIRRSDGELGDSSVGHVGGRVQAHAGNRMSSWECGGPKARKADTPLLPPLEPSSCRTSLHEVVLVTWYNMRSPVWPVGLCSGGWGQMFLAATGQAHAGPPPGMPPAPRTTPASLPLPSSPTPALPLPLHLLCHFSRFASGCLSGRSALGPLPLRLERGRERRFTSPSAIGSLAMCLSLASLPCVCLSACLGQSPSYYTEQASQS